MKKCPDGIIPLRHSHIFNYSLLQTVLIRYHSARCCRSQLNNTADTALHKFATDIDFLRKLLMDLVFIYFKQIPVKYEEARFLA